MGVSLCERLWLWLIAGLLSPGLTVIKGAEGKWLSFLPVKQQEGQQQADSVSVRVLCVF